MKAKIHLTINFLISIFLLFLLVSIFNIQGITNVGVLFLCLFLFILAALFPDSDSNNRGSTIYYTVFIPIAIIFKILEIPIAKICNRSRGHRKSLHTVLGVFITSFVLTLIIFMLISLVSIRVWWFFAIFFSIFLGQLIHLILDNELKLK